jgi:hypothetical protein
MAIADGLPGVLGAIVLGAALATAIGVALSPLTLVGPVRQVERSPGISFDWTVLAAGFLVLVVVLSAIAIGVAASRHTDRASRRRRRGIASVSTVVGGAAAAGVPTPAVTGLRFALERGPRDTAAPVRSALFGAILAVVVVVSTLTFASGLNTLVSHPALYGWNWSYAIGSEGGGPFPPAGENLLQHDPDVAGASGFGFAGVQIDGQTTPVLLAQPGAAVAPPILSGHALDASNEIVLGAATLAQLHRHVGDTVLASYGSKSSGATYVPPTPLRIVGTTTLPSLGEVGQLHVSMGTGAILPLDVEPRALQQALAVKDPLQNGWTVEVVRLRPGVAPAAGRANLVRIANQVTKLVDHDPKNPGDTDRFSVVPVQQPAEIANYRTMGTTPAYLAGALAIGAVVAPRSHPHRVSASSPARSRTLEGAWVHSAATRRDGRITSDGRRADRHAHRHPRRRVRRTTSLGRVRIADLRGTSRHRSRACDRLRRDRRGRPRQPRRGDSGTSSRAHTKCRSPAIRVRASVQAQRQCTV